MSSSTTVDDYRWLVAEEAAEILQSANTSAASLVALAARLRRTLSAQRVHLVLEQLELRRRAAVKFGNPEKMFFTRRGLEQATDQWIAAYKATRFEDGPVADLCCGMGGDLLALARRGVVRGIDRDPVMVLLAGANLAASDPSKCGSVEVADVELLDPASIQVWHMDPDRRPQGKRTTRVEWHDPGLAVIERFLKTCTAGALKLAPAAKLPPAWAVQCEQQWISQGGECRQLVAWIGQATLAPGRRSAAIVVRDAAPRTILQTDAGPAVTAERIQRYVYEPDPAVLAANLVDTLAEQWALSPLAPGVGYLTADRLHRDPAVTAFEVLEAMPFDGRKLRAAIAARRIGRLEVKKRGVDIDPATLARQLATKGDELATLLLSPHGQNVWAILARRA